MSERSDSMEAVLWEVELFLKASGMTASGFGRLVANDPRLVHDMRRGREVRPAMAARMRAAISASARR